MPKLGGFAAEAPQIPGSLSTEAARIRTGRKFGQFLSIKRDDEERRYYRTDAGSIRCRGSECLSWSGTATCAERIAKLPSYSDDSDYPRKHETQPEAAKVAWYPVARISLSVYKHLDFWIGPPN